jgi:hypothetical protein
MAANTSETLKYKGHPISRGRSHRYVKRQRAKAVRRAFKADGEDANTKCIRGWDD